MKVKVLVIYKPKDFMHGLKIAEMLYELDFKEIEIELRADKYYVNAVRILDEEVLTEKPFLQDALYILGASLPEIDYVDSLTVHVAGEGKGK